MFLFLQLLEVVIELFLEDTLRMTNVYHELAYERITWNKRLCCDTRYYFVSFKCRCFLLNEILNVFQYLKLIFLGDSIKGTMVFDISNDQTKNTTFFLRY